MMHHYGWVKKPEKQLLKLKNFNKYWHDDAWNHEHINDFFDYSGIDYLTPFKGTHPKVMVKRIAEKNWEFKHDLSRDNRTFRIKLLDGIERMTGIRIFEYKNYRLLN